MVESSNYKKSREYAIFYCNKRRTYQKNYNYCYNKITAMEKRINILKTYKLFIGGQFPRTESGRYYLLKDNSGKHLANICQASRKDFRNAVTVARDAFGGWSTEVC